MKRKYSKSNFTGAMICLFLFILSSLITVVPGSEAETFLIIFQPTIIIIGLALGIVPTKRDQQSNLKDQKNV